MRKLLKDLHVDIETYSSVDIKSAGVYRYVESVDFEILIIAYAFDSEPTQVINVAGGEGLPLELSEALVNPAIKKNAHNATFERLAFRNFGLEIPIEQWHCSAIKAAYIGLPFSLDGASKALGFDEEKTKLTEGKALIKYFSCPCSPTKANGKRFRNLSSHAPDKWQRYKDYCIQDVEVEKEIVKVLKTHTIPNMDRRLYALDQKINDKGVLIDLNLANGAFRINEDHSKLLNIKVKKLTGVGNPNSLPQLKKWLSLVLGREIKALAKEDVANLIEEERNLTVKEVLGLRQLLSKSSIKKYKAMLNSACKDKRGHGFFQFYGANRTGRWAGRLVQLQNLTKNHLHDLPMAKEMIRSGDYKNVEIVYGDVSDTLSQLIRTAFIAPKDKVLAIVDYSAIEARIIAWLAEESWRMEIFKKDGKIYEASASSMFNIPIEKINAPLRQKGKVAELALGYQGSVGALTKMGGEKMGLSKVQMEDIVSRWRRASPNIVQLWKDLEGCAKQALRSHEPITSKHKGLVFECADSALTIKLPSDRKLFYREPKLGKKTVWKENGESWEAESLTYMGMDQTKKQWTRLDTYGGKLVENIVQAIARDVLGHSMLTLDEEGFDIVLHVHDEVVCEVALSCSKEKLSLMSDLMTREIPWLRGLPLKAEGYLTPFYKKE